MKPDPASKNKEKEAARIAYLVVCFLRQTLTKNEHDELDAWITSHPGNQRLFEELIDPDIVGQRMEEWEEPKEDLALEKIKQRIQFSNQGSKRRTPVILKYGIAASIVLLAGIYLIYTLMNRNVEPTIQPISNDNLLKPGGNYAILILANGDTVNLGNTKNGLIDSSSGSEVMKTAEGQLSYENPEARIVAFHSLQTPVGGQYSVTLPDGSRVWLNSSSSLKYPVAFTGKERVVELKGEGYFEISPSTSADADARIPFIVKLEGASIEVLGTKFNVNAYHDEDGIKTTLVEGKVQVRTNLFEPGKIESSVMVAGQQARIIESRIETTTVGEADIEEVLAWKNGKFRFKDEPIESIMRQVGRWYGSDVAYEGKIDFHFNATILRNEPIDRLLEILEETGRVKFKVDGRKIVVRP